MKALALKARAVLQSYTRALDGFRAARDATEVRAWFEENVGAASGFGFNGDVVRARILADLYRLARCTAFVETGTFRGTTTILAARLFGGRVWSCELNGWSWLVSSLRCLPYRRVSVMRQDSRRFLRSVVDRLTPSDAPMFYLDAHWNADLPLREELDLILGACPHCVVVIDDFEVPEQPGFKFDVYGESKLSLQLLASVGGAHGGATAYFPAYPPELDTGARCGYIVVMKGIGMPDGSDSAFVPGLLKRA
jgi:hypothetical protein